MQCHELSVFLEQEGLAPLSAEARQHLSGCGACLHLVEDLTSIVEVAHEFPAELEPPQRVWVSIQRELVREGVIRESSKAPVGASWWESLLELFRNRSLAIAAVAAMLLLVAVQLSRTPKGPVLEAHDDPFGTTVNMLSQQEHDLTNMQLASTGTPSAVDTSLRQNLQQVDEFIADCEHRVKEEPSDELAREYLTNAYQQKATLLSAMMDRGGSLN